MKYRIFAIILIILLIALGYFVYASTSRTEGWFSKFPFKLGLDLAGGTELTYRADISGVEGNVGDSMEALREVIERRVNLFGVGEPVVQIEEASTLGGTKENKLIVELPGVTDINEAIKKIGETPTLEFRLMRDGAQELLPTSEASTTPPIDTLFEKTGLTGRLLKRAMLEFNPTTNEPIVSLEFNDEGRALFAKITRENVGRTLAIFLDEAPISLPTVREEITEGKAQISGGFTPAEAKALVRNLNYGALPVPIELVGTQTVGATLGKDAVESGIKAGLWGFILVVLFLILWYRLPGLVATLALCLYITISLAMFKLIPVTLTAAGIAGFILSIGMAVDANILIFERMKEELKRGKNLHDAIHEGFHRAWLSIRDSNISSLITALVLFWVGTSSIKGFAFTFGIGVLISMFTAITASRILLYAISIKRDSRLVRFLFSNGFTNFLSRRL